MELTPGVVLFALAAVVASVILIRWARRNEAAAPVEMPSMPARTPAAAAGVRDPDQTLVTWLLDRASEQTGMRLHDDSLVRQRVSEAAGKAMEDLRADRSATISLPFLVAAATGPKHFSVQFKRNPDSTFEVQA